MTRSSILHLQLNKEKRKVVAIFVTGIFFLLILTFFLHNLGTSSLHPWDEAWYASIARNVSRGSILDLNFNGRPFWDHPPLGLYLMAISASVLGFNEFAIRLPAALAGFLTVVLVFITGKRLGNYWTGLASALILLSTRWFLFRSRSGNLDAFLLLTQLLVFYFAYSARSLKDLYVLWFLYGLSFMSKSAISLTLLPLVFISSILFVRRRHFSWLTLIRITLISLSAFLIPVLLWYGYNTILYGKGFLERNLIAIGLRGGSAQGLTAADISRTFLYLHSAIHKWYRPLQISLLFSLFWLMKRPVRWTVAYLLLSLFPYLLSPQTEIWHLLPVTVPMALIIPLVAQNVLKTFTTRLLPGNLNQATLAVNISIFLFIAGISSVSIFSYWREFINLPPSVSEAAKLAKIASRYPGPVILQSAAFFPTVVFYSDRQVEVIEYNPTIMDHLPAPPYQMLVKDEGLSTGKNFIKLGEAGESVLVLIKPSDLGD